MKKLVDFLYFGSEAIAKVLVDTMGGSRWTKYDMDRVYFNDFGKLFFDLTKGKFDTREATEGYEAFITEIENRDFTEDFEFIAKKSVNGVFSQADGWDGALSAIKYALKSGIVDGVFQTDLGVFVYKHIKKLAISNTEAVRGRWHKESERFKKKLDRSTPFRNMISTMVQAGGIDEDGFYALPIPVLTDKFSQNMHFNYFNPIYDVIHIECIWFENDFEKSGLYDLYEELVEKLNEAWDSEYNVVKKTYN